MINIGGTAGTVCEIWADLERDRVMIVADHLYAFWRAEAEAEELAQHLIQAASEVRRRRAERK